MHAIRQWRSACDPRDRHPDSIVRHMVGARHPLKSKFVTTPVAGFCLSLYLAFTCLPQTAAAQQTLVLISNHDVKLQIAGDTQHVTHQAKVRNTKTFPIEFQMHRMDVSVSNIGNGKYRATLSLLEQTDMGWERISMDDLSFEAMYGAPVQYQWQAGDISVDLAIAVSVYQR